MGDKADTRCHTPFLLMCFCTTDDGYGKNEVNTPEVADLGQEPETSLPSLPVGSNESAIAQEKKSAKEVVLQKSVLNEEAVLPEKKTNGEQAPDIQQGPKTNLQDADRKAVEIQASEVNSKAQASNTETAGNKADSNSPKDPTPARASRISYENKAEAKPSGTEVAGNKADSNPSTDPSPPPRASRVSYAKDESEKKTESETPASPTSVTTEKPFSYSGFVVTLRRGLRIVHVSVKRGAAERHEKDLKLNREKTALLFVKQPRTKYFVRDLQAIRKGHEEGSQALAKLKSDKFLPATVKEQFMSRSLSLIFSTVAIDFICQNEEQMEMLSRGFQEMMKRLKEKNKV